MTDRRRSGQTPQSAERPDTVEAAGTDQAPLWLIALPSFACTVALGGYLLMTIGSRVL